MEGTFFVNVLMGKYANLKMKYSSSSCHLFKLRQPPICTFSNFHISFFLSWEIITYELWICLGYASK